MQNCTTRACERSWRSSERERSGDGEYCNWNQSWTWIGHIHGLDRMVVVNIQILDWIRSANMHPCPTMNGA